jgi:hypothetical protein
MCEASSILLWDCVSRCDQVHVAAWMRAAAAAVPRGLCFTVGEGEHHGVCRTRVEMRVQLASMFQLVFITFASAPHKCTDLTAIIKFTNSQAQGISNHHGAESSMLRSFGAFEVQ